MTESKITEYKSVFSKGQAENYSREIFNIDSVLQTNPSTYKIKGLNGENITGSFNEK